MTPCAKTAAAPDNLISDTRSFAGLSLARPLIMAIVNVTPDSFSDGGETFAPELAIDRARALAKAGADIVDIGAESTRPGATPVDPAEELARLRPVLDGLGDFGCPISVDTRRAVVMAAAIAAGARIINDVAALEGDPRSLEIVAGSSVSVVLMHMAGEPATMNERPQYRDVVGDVFDYLSGRVEACIEAGIERRRIAVDPGIGFGKTMSDNRAILANLGEFRNIGCPLMVGVSRKLGRAAEPKERLRESLEAAVDAVKQGADILRVHDVVETRDALGLGL